MENGDTVRGLVKWFDVTKGFGFIVSDDHASDILLHANVLRTFGQNSVANNARLEIVVQVTDRGSQAIEILKIEAPEFESGPDSLRQILGDDVLLDPDAALLPARVKWFDRIKGFGFANIFGQSDDIFVHIEVLQACGLSELQPGEAIAIKTAIGPRGRMAWDVRVWDQAIDKGLN